VCFQPDSLKETERGSGVRTAASVGGTGASPYVVSVVLVVNSGFRCCYFQSTVSGKEQEASESYPALTPDESDYRKLAR
jgi:hypothetical protein